jgi:ubiquinone/menaquinone biosynthesis C-methylase UbiE
MVNDLIVKIEDIKNYWNENPLCAASIPYPLGSPEYFKYYDKLREANESIEFSSALHDFKGFTGKKVLDVGCGNGYTLSRYALEGAEVHGVDITETGIDLCRKRFELLGLKGHFSVENAERLPFGNATFDCVCSMGVLHHVPHPEIAFEEIFRILKKGGRIIVMVYHKNSVLYRFRMMWISLKTGKSMKQLVNEVDGIGNPKGDVYSRRELRELLHQFDHISMFAGLLQGWMISPKFSSILPYKILSYLAKRFGWFLYAKAIKP